MHLILVPGMWLDGASWGEVAPSLEEAGHTVQALTLPGMASVEADRSGITLADHVAAVVEAIDAANGDVVLVGHSAGAGICHAAIDARPDKVAHAVYVGGFPTPDGSALASGFTAEAGEVPLPDWSEFDEADLRGLDDGLRDRFRSQAIPTPEHVVSDPQTLSDVRRYLVPVTMICPEFSAADLREWVDAGEESVAELSRIEQVGYVDLPTGHWPQLTAPEALARAILAVTPAGRGRAG